MVLGGVFLVIYLDTVLRTFKGLFTSEGVSGVLILLFCIYMIWDKRKKFKEVSIRPSITMGLIVTVMGMSVFLAGQFTAILLLKDISIIITSLGLIWLIFGYGTLKLLLLPISYMLLMFQFFQEILGNFSIYFQLIAAQIAAVLLRLVGMDLYLSGIIIEMPHISLEVARSCSGIHHIIALIAVAIPLADMYQKTWYKKGAFVLFAFFVGIFANGIRVAMIGIWALFYKGHDLHGPFDLFYVSFIMVFGILLIVIANYFSARTKPRISSLPSAEINSKKRNHSPQSRQLLSITLGIVLLLIPIGYMKLFIVKSVDLNGPLSGFQTYIEGWSISDTESSDWPIKDLSWDEKFQRTYINTTGSEKISLYIGYFSKQSQGKELINTKTDWMFRKAKSVPILFQDQTIEFKKTRFHGIDNPLFGKEKPKTLYFCYVINGKIYSDRYSIKLANLKDIFLNHKNNGAIIIFLSDRYQERSNGSIQSDQKFIQTMLPAIVSYLKAP